MTPPPHLSPSELGTKEYWDTHYTSDLTTHSLNPTHTGPSWFSDALAPAHTLTYLRTLGLDLQKTTFLDLGTGNGELLFYLRSQGGFTGKMLGIDYSAASISLASNIARQRGYHHKNNPTKRKEEEEEAGEGGISFKQWDILSPPHPWASGPFDIVLDKGTFDAISLNPDTDAATGKRVCENYKSKIMGMVRKGGGRFLVTSCNWTEEELRGWFEGREEMEEEDGGFVWEGRVEYPRFRFGGGEGQSCYGVCFRRV
ncbi:MAG: hypothetical protein Q9220_001900 [cf. Caloplaca sp. 1 TL-2023]